MKKVLLTLSAFAFILSGCHDHPKPPVEHCKTTFKYHPGKGGVSSTDSSYDTYIPVDSANIMISSYLNSINYQQNDTDLHSLDYNADSLRAYLSDQRVVGVKFMLAHSLDYINQGGRDQYAGYQSGALTLVIAGYDAQGEYVFYYYPKNPNVPMVKEYCEPCPMHCPTTGPAASAFIVNANNGNGHK